MESAPDSLSPKRRPFKVVDEGGGGGVGEGSYVHVKSSRPFSAMLTAEEAAPGRVSGKSGRGHGEANKMTTQERTQNHMQILRSWLKVRVGLAEVTKGVGGGFYYRTTQNRGASEP